MTVAYASDLTQDQWELLAAQGLSPLFHWLPLLPPMAQ